MNRFRSLNTLALLALTAIVPFTATAQAVPAKPADAAKPAAQRGRIPTSWEQIPIPPLSEFHPQQPKRIELSNGLVIFLQEDHELPLINGTIAMRGGNRDAPAEKTGLIAIYGQSWRAGGTESHTGDQMDDFLEARGAYLETGGDIDSTGISWSSLKTDFDDVFKLAIELLTKPAFREDKIALAKDSINTSIARRNDGQVEIAGREANRLAYGRDNPYVRMSEYSTVAAVRRDDLVEWHKRTVYSSNMIVSVIGDFDSEAMEAKLRETFGSWPRGNRIGATRVEFTPPKPGYYFVAKDDVNQSAIRMVTLGIRLDDPDYYPVSVMNHIFFSGGFSARMMQEVRTRRGLAYATGGALGAAFDHPGVFVLSAHTKSGTTVEAINAVYGVMQEAVRKPATPAELNRAKDAILNRFVFNFDSKARVLAQRVVYEFYGYPPDTLERYRAGIENVTLADVARVAQKYINKDRMAVLVVGNAQDFDKPLNSMGPVTTLDISIPAPASVGDDTARGKRPYVREDLERLQEISRPSLSPDGKWVAYTTGFHKERDGLWLASTRNAIGNPQRIQGYRSSDFLGLPELAWLPGGSCLAVGTNRQGLESRKIFPVRDACSMFDSLLSNVDGPWSWSSDAQMAFIDTRKRPAQIHIVHAATRRIRQVTFDDMHKATLAWSPDENLLAYTTVKPTAVWIGSPLADNLSFRVIWREPSGGEILAPKLLWSPNGGFLLLRGFFGGRRVAVLISKDGKRSVVLPDFEYAGWTHDSKALVGSDEATHKGKMTSQVVLVDASTLDAKPLTHGETFDLAFGTAVLDENGRQQTLIAFTSESADRPRDAWTAVLGSDQTLHKQQNVSNGNPWVTSVAFPVASLYRWISAEGHTLEATLHLPSQSRNRLPLLVIPYGRYGYTFHKSTDYLTRLALELVAKGWAVVLPNTRGSAVLDEADRGRLGQPQLADTHRLIDALAADLIIDPARVAVLGASWGGTLAYYYLTHSARFCGVISVNGIADFVTEAQGVPGLTQDAITSRVGGTPAERPELYRESSPLMNVGNTRAPLLAVAGEKDGIINPQHAHRMVGALRSIGKDATLLSFPTEGHSILHYANINEFLDRSIAFLERSCPVRNAVYPVSFTSPLVRLHLSR